MKKKLAIVAMLAFVAAFALALVGCGGGSSNNASSAAAPAPSATSTAAATNELGTLEDGKIKVIGSLDFPPFENLEGGEVVGFEVDLVNEIGNRLGVDIVIENQKFDTIVPTIAAGAAADMGVSGITITPERAEEVLFTDPVIDSNQSIVVLKDSGIENISQLEGKKIAAQSGTTGSDWAKENIPGAEVIDLDEATACFSALQAGQADAVSIDLPVAEYTIKTAYPDAIIIQETPTGEQYGFVINKDNPALQAAINKALADMRADGTYQQIFDAWFTAE